MNKNEKAIGVSWQDVFRSGMVLAAMGLVWLMGLFSIKCFADLLSFSGARVSQLMLVLPVVLIYLSFAWLGVCLIALIRRGFYNLSYTCFLDEDILGASVGGLIFWACFTFGLTVLGGFISLISWDIGPLVIFTLGGSLIGMAMGCCIVFVGIKEELVSLSQEKLDKSIEQILNSQPPIGGGLPDDEIYSPTETDHGIKLEEAHPVHDVADLPKHGLTERDGDAILGSVLKPMATEGWGVGGVVLRVGGWKEEVKPTEEPKTSEEPTSNIDGKGAGVAVGRTD